MQLVITLFVILYEVVSVFFIFILHFIVLISLPFMIPFHFVKVMFERLFEGVEK